MTTTAARGIHGHQLHRSGAAPTLDSLIAQRSGLERCEFETVNIDTHIGEVAGVDAQRLPANLQNIRLPQQSSGRAGPAAGRLLRCRASRGRPLGPPARSGCSSAPAPRASCRLNWPTARAIPISGALPQSVRIRRPPTTHSRSRITFGGVAGWKARPWPCPLPAHPAPRCSARRRRMIEAGLIDAALVGGTDSLCLTTLYGFHSLQLSSPAPCRPFDVARDGISIGEAAAFALLERLPERLHGDSVLLLRHRRIERCLSHVGAAPGGLGRKARHAVGARPPLSLDARRHRLHQFARHRNPEQRSLRKPGGHQHLRSDHALQLDQGRDRPYLGCRRRARGGHQRAAITQWIDAGRRPDHADRPDSHGALHQGESARAAVGACSAIPSVSAARIAV